MRIENLYEYADKLVARGYIEESDRLVESLNKIVAKVEKGEDVKEDLYRLYDFSDFFIEKGYEEIGEQMVEDIKRCINNAINKSVRLFAVIKLSVEEAIKDSDTTIWTFSSYEDAKKVWEEEAKLMEEDANNYSNSSFELNEDLMEAIFDYDDFSSILQLRELKDGEITVVTF